MPYPEAWQVKSYFALQGLRPIISTAFMPITPTPIAGPNVPRAIAIAAVNSPFVTPHFQ